MSSTRVLGFMEGEDYEFVKEFHNSHGAAPVIWSGMLVEYYGVDYHEWAVRRDLLDKLWPRWKDLSIPKYQRAVLMMTFDKCYVHRDYYSRAAKDITKWLDTFEPPEKYVNHWPELITLYESKPDYHGIGIWHTSVSGNPFEDKEYNFVGFDETHNLYKELDNLQPKTEEK